MSFQSRSVAARTGRGFRAVGSMRPLVPQSGRRRGTRCCALQLETEKANMIKQLKAELFEMAGDAVGQDMSEEEQAVVVKHLEKFKGLGPQSPENIDLTGSSWANLFTTSKQSSGYFGPFRGESLQIFPAEEPGKLYNTAALFGNAFRMDFDAEYYPAKAKGKVVIDFKTVKMSLFGRQVSESPFPSEKTTGSWDVWYADDAMRIFETNLGNYTALYNTDLGKMTDVPLTRYK